MPTRLLLISHAATAAMRNGTFPGDDALDAFDARAITASAAASISLRERLPRMADTVAFCSPAACARDTAAAFGLAAGIAPELAEMDYGRWRGRRLAEIAADDPDGLTEWTSDPDAAPHGGESFAVMRMRVAKWLDGIGDANSAKTVVAVVHASLIRAAILHALEVPSRTFYRIEIAPLSVVELRHSARGWSWWPGQSGVAP